MTHLNVKYERLTQTEPVVKQSYLTYIGVVGCMMFFVLYLAFSTDQMSLSSSQFELVTSLLKASNNSISTSRPRTNFTTDLVNDGNITATFAESTTTEVSATGLLDNPPIPKTGGVNITANYAIYTEKCRIRNYDFNDNAIIKKYFTDKPYMCRKEIKPFVFYPQLVNGTFCIGVNKTIFDKHYASSYPKIDSWNCTYKETMRDTSYTNRDLHYKFGPESPMKPGLCPIEEFIWVECKFKKLELYEQPLLIPVIKSAAQNVKQNNLRKAPLNVLIVGLDSVSRLNAHRQFPQTIKFLQSKPNLIELFGYNKIGLNSAPNQIPLLTGVNHVKLRKRIGSGYFDSNALFLWDDFGLRGYRSMFYEEQWNYGLFVYPSSNGFKEVPTTYWPRPLMQKVDGSDLKAKDGKWCIGGDYPAKHYLDYTLNTMRLLGKGRPLFSYSWLSETGHDQVNGGHRVDAYFLDLFQQMDNEGILNNTAVFFISDHGFRFGAFRKTALGRYEDMLPYGFVLMPPSYYETYPEALKLMKINSRRLITVYDLHASLLELTDAWDEDRITRTANGLSIFSNEVPSNKTCASSGIDFQFCSCFEPQPYDRSHELAKSLAAFTINEINTIIKKNKADSKCLLWKLGTIDDFIRLSEGQHWTSYFKMSLKMIPEAQFEVIAQYNADKNTWTLISNIDRTDWFSSHAKCVAKTSYERYCYCK